MAVRYFCDRCGSEFKPNGYIKIHVSGVIDEVLDTKGFYDRLCNECIKDQIPDNRIQGDWVNSNKYLRKDDRGNLILVSEKGDCRYYLVSAEGQRNWLINKSPYIKPAGLTLTEDTSEGVLTLDCIPEPWRSKVIEREGLEAEKTPEEWINGNKYLRKDERDRLILVDEDGERMRYLVGKDGRRFENLAGTPYIKPAGLTLTENTLEGVLTLDCIPEPWRSKVIEYERKDE